MNEEPTEPLLLVFGGTFDPIHNGHIGVAVEAQKQLKAASVSLLPCGVPVHKNGPAVTAQHRVGMIQAALSELNASRLSCAEFTADTREIERDRPSYTIDTLIDLRKASPSRAIAWLVGMDSFVNLASWDRWQSLTDYANLVVVNRPGEVLPQAGAVFEWAKSRIVDARDLKKYVLGKVSIIEIPPSAVSSSSVREKLNLGYTVEEDIPNAVYEYINLHALYQHA